VKGAWHQVAGTLPLTPVPSNNLHKMRESMREWHAPRRLICCSAENRCGSLQAGSQHK